MTPLDKVRDAHYRTSGKQLTGRNPYNGFCPCHQDRKRSLSVTETDGTVLLHCHAECPTEDVVGAWMLSMSDL